MNFLLTIFVAILAISIVQAQADKKDDFCYPSVIGGCPPQESPDDWNCTAAFGGLSRGSDRFSSLNVFVNTHIERSFDFLLMSTYYSSYQKNRAGFEKVLRGLSDTAWEDSMKLIKYITKRGGSVNFTESVASWTGENRITYETHELESLARAIDIQKNIANAAHDIHEQFSKVGESFDPDVASFLEDNFIHKHSDTIRVLSGHMNDLKNLLTHHPHDSVQVRHLAVFMFDEYLQKL